MSFLFDSSTGAIKRQSSGIGGAHGRGSFSDERLPKSRHLETFWVVLLSFEAFLDVPLFPEASIPCPSELKTLSWTNSTDSKCLSRDYGLCL